MSKLRTSFLNLLQEVGDRSGCHQIPERSFCIKGYTFPVCARCTGVTAGQLAAVVLFPFGILVPWWAAAALLFLMGLDWLIQYAGIKESNNIRRLITGICGGFGLFSIYLHILRLLIHVVQSIF